MKHIPRVVTFLQAIVVTLLFTFSLIFFRSETIQQALLIIRTIFYDTVLPVTFSPEHFTFLRGVLETTGKTVFIFVLASICVVEIVQYYQDKYGTKFIFEKKSNFIRYAWYYGLTTSILIFGYFGGETFIYFQF